MFKSYGHTGRQTWVQLAETPVQPFSDETRGVQKEHMAASSVNRHCWKDRVEAFWEAKLQWRRAAAAAATQKKRTWEGLSKAPKQGERPAEASSAPAAGGGAKAVVKWHAGPSVPAAFQHGGWPQKHQQEKPQHETASWQVKWTEKDWGQKCRVTGKSSEAPDSFIHFPCSFVSVSIFHSYHILSILPILF